MALSFTRFIIPLRQHSRHLGFVFALACVAHSPLAHSAQAQENEYAQAEVVDPKAPIFWANGITQIKDLDKYKEAGFNTVVVRLTWLASPGGEISARNLGPQRLFAEAAAKRGLKVIYALPSAPTGADINFRLSADSDAYITLWTTWLQDAMTSLRSTKNLVGWMLPDDPRGLNIYDDIGFRRWLGSNYANVGVINRQWTSAFDTMEDINISDVDDASANWREKNPLEGTSDPAAEYNRRLTKQNWAFHPAALSLAHYKWDAYRALLTAWAGAVRGEDRNHLVFSGRTPDYAQLLSLPAGIDVAMPDMSPGVAENDIVTHNPQAMDIARRGGKFGVMPMLSARPSADLPAASLPDLTKRWIDEAWTHGSRGIGFTSWADIEKVPGLGTVISQEIEALTTAPTIGGWGNAPVNTTAVLVTPLADGATLLYGEPPSQHPRGLYGFGEDMVNGEPSNLIWMLRWGTAFGGIDYISPDDLEDAPLERYTTIIAPQTLSATGETVSRLSRYVSNGGVLIADLGIGAFQNGGEVNALSPQLASLFGVPDTFELRQLPFNLSGVSAHPLLPTWSTLTTARPGLNLTLGDGNNGFAFTGLIGLSPKPPSAQIVATGPRIQDVGLDERVKSTQLTINPFGRGYAIFAPFRLWSNWRPGQNGFDTFLGEIINRGAAVVMAGATSLVPQPITQTIGSPLFPEIINRSGSITLSNHTPKSGLPQLAAVQTSGAGDWLWTNALTSFPTGADFQVSGGRRPPIEDASELESRPHALALYDLLGPGESHQLVMRPIAVQNLAGGSIVAELAEEKEASVRVHVWPNASRVVAEAGRWQTAIAEPAPVRLTLVSVPDGYKALPGTKHRATIVDYTKPAGKNKFLTVQKEAQAGIDGRLSFEFSGAACLVTIAPVTETEPEPKGKPKK